MKSVLNALNHSQERKLVCLLHSLFLQMCLVNLWHFVDGKHCCLLGHSSLIWRYLFHQSSLLLMPSLPWIKQQNMGSLRLQVWRNLFLKWVVNRPGHLIDNNNAKVKSSGKKIILGRGKLKTNKPREKYCSQGVTVYLATFLKRWLTKTWNEHFLWKLKNGFLAMRRFKVKQTKDKGETREKREKKDYRT